MKKKIYDILLLIIAIFAGIGLIICAVELVRYFSLRWGSLGRLGVDNFGSELALITIRNGSFVLQFVAWITSLSAIVIAVGSVLGIREMFQFRKARHQLLDDIRELNVKHEKYQRSVENFEKSIEEKLKNEGNLIRAKIFYTQGHYEDAWEVLKDMLASYEVCLYKGMVLARRKDYSDALTSLNAALQFKRGDKARVHFNIGKCWEENLQYEEAIKSYDLAIEIKGNYWAAYNNKALSLKRLGRINDAIAELKKIIGIDKNNERAYYNLGCYYAILEDHKEALKCLKRAVELSPKLKSMATTDSDFANLVESEEFKEITKDDDGVDK
ncbi:MAG: tetratricopeptide repeat protein [Candidatus Omnitrophica bacterium]|nr:tetratricopeptide repeat protein [Candidatus Omnitrophota bacterium]